ncbi:hypothetical protein M569_02141 [Genlisea aurea]|uniref:Uncharacterized protein n=1 Tax=Genlisea aurea TaxID=192259 RepID=S8CZY8_9LAMI|nr:hypothetical protein M569_02141 [Genlisea aurea]
MGGGSRSREIEYSTINGAASSVFGPVPSRREVETAIVILQRQTDNPLGLSTPSPELDGLRTLMPPGFPKLHTLLQQPSLMNTVVSISSDRAVWEAILKNKAIQDLEPAAILPSSSGGPDMIVRHLVEWMVEFAKCRIMELVGKFEMLVHEIFDLLLPEEKKKNKGGWEFLNEHHLDDKVRSSLLLSVIILVLVVVMRFLGRS